MEQPLGFVAQGLGGDRESVLSSKISVWFET